MSLRAWREGAYGQSNSSLPCSYVQEADKDRKTLRVGGNKRVSAPGPPTSEQVGEVTSRTAIMIPIRLQPEPDHIEPSGLWPSACRRTRPPSVLALRLRVSAFRPQRRTSRFRFTDLVVGHVVAGHHYVPPRQPKIGRPLFYLRSTRRHSRRPRYGAAQKLTALSAQTSGDDRMMKKPIGTVEVATRIPHPPGTG